MSAPDPVALGVLVGRLRSICDEMGAILIRAAHSPNIKERRDCSTALFDSNGELVMQAEHIPVHLGSMPDAVAAVLDEEQEEGVSWILNDPFAGGTHLPDITLITPVFAGRSDPVGFVASRAHHADVGGSTPGSMPADSTTLDEEGVVITPRRTTGVDDLGDLIDRMRAPSQRLADLRAQWAANQSGSERLAELIGANGDAEGALAGMAEILNYAERRTRARLESLPDAEHDAEDVLEAGPDGTQDAALRVRATLSGDELTLDFSGTDEQLEGNLNCPLSVTRSAALFAVRVLIDPDAPPSAGGHRPVRVIAPEGSILNARRPAAVAGGNVETSCRVADLVLAALGEVAAGPAQGQGTMNNVTLADVDGDWTYYETLGGGQGACADAPGPDAIHVTMSNTLNTPVEALETELPVRVRELSLRRDAGGQGAEPGGRGMIREFEALAEMSFNLITERRRHAPRGRAGGSDGTPGRNLLNGSELPGKASGRLEKGDRLRIETPGGGGYGSPTGDA
ncbi:hydantoinase B/oxoprolinase family protein [soil metagenome]